MNEQEIRIQKLQEELDACKKELSDLTLDQQNAAKLLIRRDLALSRANEQLKALDEAKSKFISVAAHQLRTPLSAIKWILHMINLGQFKDEIERQDFLHKATESTDRMISLVNDLLEVDHIESGKDHFAFLPVDCNDLVVAVVSDVSALAEERNITIVTDMKAKAKVVGDSTKLRDLFQNLIENAIKYSSPNGTVQVSSTEEDTCVSIVIQDSGIGIPDDEQDQIFSKFFRAPNALKAQTVGSGLGLFIAKEIVKRHGGKIWFESKVGTGTTFFVNLPKVQ
jgi:signal transduction histidine kinase